MFFCLITHRKVDLYQIFTYFCVIKGNLLCYNEIILFD